MTLTNRTRLRRVFRPDGRRSPGGVSVLELLLLTCVMAVFAALLFPAIQQSRVAARNVQDINRLRQMGIAVHQHADLFGRLPGSRTERCGAEEGWSFAVLPGSGESNQLMLFDPTAPREAAVNLMVASQSRPSLFASAADGGSEEPWFVAPLDDPSARIPVLPSAYAFNGFILRARLEHLPTSQTALLCRFGNCGMWINSPEFWSLDITTDAAALQPLLVCFADGSVRRLTAMSDVIVAPGSSVLSGGFAR